MNHRYDLLRIRRKQLGLTLRDAGELAKLSHSSIQDLEKKDSNPSSKKIKAACKAYGIQPSLIMNFEITKEQFLSIVGNGANERPTV